MAKNTSTAKKTTDVTNKPKGEKGAKAKGEIFYIVYVDTYVTDEKILPRGVYQTESPIERLDASRPKFVRKFEGKIPDNILHEVAETLKIKVTEKSGDYRDSKEILAEMVTSI